GPQITLITQINRIQKTKINKSFGKSRNPFSKGFLAAGGILYCTGDLGRWLNDGNIEFLGRIDHQVKIRGFRIELGEIETLLLKHGQVKDAVVVLKEDDTGDTYLAAYFVSGQEIPGLELREFLAKDLPDYMVPSYFMQLEKLPLNPSGKVDRKALPGPQLKAQTQYTPPVDELEKQLVKIWAEVLIGKNDNLAANPIGRYDNFFMAGGHSLKAMRLAASIHKQFNVKIPVAELFKSPTIEAMARFIRDASIDANALIEPGEKKDFYQTSPAQAIVYIIQQMKPTSTAYNMPVIFDINGFIRTEPIENAFRKLIARHEGLRTFFQLIEGKPVQRICQEIDFKIAKKAGINFDHFISAFDLAKAPLLRVILLKIEEEKHILVIDMHHIISDGISQSVLVKDFLAVYRGMPLPPLTIQYKDFSEWQRKQLSGDFFKKQEEYWLNRLKDPIPVLNLPTDYPRPDVQSFKGQTINSRIGETLTNQMKVIAAEQGATLYMILLAIYTVLLSKYANQNDFIIGSPAAGRRHADLEPIVGMFINVILMRNPIHSKITFTHFLDQVKDNALQAFDNQDYPIDHLAGKLGIKRDESRNPLYEIIFALVDSENTEFSIPGLAVNPVKYEVENTKTDLRLGISEKNNEIITTLTYAASLFKRKTVENMLAHYVEIIEQVAADKNIKIGDIKISHHLTTLNSNIFKEDHDEFNF
ncbi:MAG: condensation domain-containing protein, partial [Acidobacteria bacterium]|nr:condensation domain-containing protein [Acidobacteriota bacterium]